MERIKAAAKRLIETLDETRDWNHDYYRRLREEKVFSRVVEICAAWLAEFRPEPRGHESIHGFAELPEELTREIENSLFEPDVQILAKAINKCFEKRDNDLEIDLEQAAREATQLVLDQGI